MDTHTCYECFYCDKKFQTKEILFNHIESMHLGEKTKKCDGTRMWGPNLKLRKRYIHRLFFHKFEANLNFPGINRCRTRRKSGKS